MYDKKISKVWRHMLFYPLPCHKLSHFLRPLPPFERAVLYGRHPVSWALAYGITLFLLLAQRVMNWLDNTLLSLHTACDCDLYLKMALDNTLSDKAPLQEKYLREKRQ